MQTPSGSIYDKYKFIKFVKQIIACAFCVECDESEKYTYQQWDSFQNM